MNVDEKEFEKIKTELKKIDEFKNLDIKESWFYDINRLDDEIKEKQKFLRVVKRERKLQPDIPVFSIITKETGIMEKRYQIGISLSNKIIYCKDW